MTARLWAMIALLSFLWGSSFVFNGVALSELQPVTIVFVRVLIGALALIVIAMASGPRGRLDARMFGAFCVMAALNIVLPFLLIVWGQTQIPSGLASIFNATTPLFAVVFAHLFTDMLAPIAFLLESPLAAFSASWQTWGALVGLGVLSTAGGYVLYFRLLAAAGATNLMLVTFLMPVTAIVLGWLVLGEHLRPAHFAGMALIACGLAAIDGRVVAWARRSWARGRRGRGA